MFGSVIIGLDPIIRYLPFRRKADISETSGAGLPGQARQ